MPRANAINTFIVIAAIIAPFAREAADSNIFVATMIHYYLILQEVYNYGGIAPIALYLLSMIEVYNVLMKYNL